MLPPLQLLPLEQWCEDCFNVTVKIPFFEKHRPYAASTQCTFNAIHLLLWCVFPLNVNVLHSRRMQVFVFYFCLALNP